MKLAALSMAVRAIEIDCGVILGRKEDNLNIGKTTLARIKTIFERLKVENETNLLTEVISTVRYHYGYERAIYFFERGEFPTEIVLFRRANLPTSLSDEFHLSDSMSGSGSSA